MDALSQHQIKPQAIQQMNELAVGAFEQPDGVQESSIAHEIDSDSLNNLECFISQPEL